MFFCLFWYMVHHVSFLTITPPLNGRNNIHVVCIVGYHSLYKLFDKPVMLMLLKIKTLRYFFHSRLTFKRSLAKVWRIGWEVSVCYFFLMPDDLTVDECSNTVSLFSLYCIRGKAQQLVRFTQLIFCGEIWASMRLEFHFWCWNLNMCYKKANCPSCSLNSPSYYITKNQIQIQEVM